MPTMRSTRAVRRVDGVAAIVDMRDALPCRGGPRGTRRRSRPRRPGSRRPRRGRGPRGATPSSQLEGSACSDASERPQSPRTRGCIQHRRAVRRRDPDDGAELVDEIVEDGVALGSVDMTPRSSAGTAIGSATVRASVPSLRRSVSPARRAWRGSVEIGFACQASMLVPRRSPSATLVAGAYRRAPLDRHPRGRGHGGRRRGGGAARPPPSQAARARRDGHRGRRAVRPLRACFRGRACATRAACVLQMWAYLATYQMPNDDPEALERRVKVAYPVRADRVIGARDDADAPAPARPRTSRALPPLGEGARVVALALVRVPARHRRLPAAAPPGALRARRRADLRDVRPRADRLLGGADGPALVRRQGRA